MTLHTSLAAPKVSIHNGKAVTTSLDVADYFGKLHKNVIRSIETLDCSPEFNRLNFEPVGYSDAKGEKRPMYTMTKDGFVFLVMGFTGKKAAAFKEAYIAEFNRMEARLSSAVQPAPTRHKTPDCRYRVQVTIWDDLLGGKLAFVGKANSFRSIAAGIATDLGYRPTSFVEIPDALEKLSARRIH
ncbi:Rha family transcriptional regulator [Candidatus Sodalis sp. SoCistrobi]|uniref:Rha family transcriptional regulator n=1 Tax=Candidatus Sodalis sp. SoCistrobi TaxID=1922216 RepID=UPI0009FE792B